MKPKKCVLSWFDHLKLWLNTMIVEFSRGRCGDVHLAYEYKVYWYWKIANAKRGFSRFLKIEEHGSKKLVKDWINAIFTFKKWNVKKRCFE